MTQHLSQKPPVTDPDLVQETVCDGPFHVSIHGNIATLTFTHARLNPTALFKEGTVNVEAVVRARIVLTAENLFALRDLLSRVQGQNVQLPPAGHTTH